MSMLWILPPAILLIGLAIAIWLLRSIEHTAAEVRRNLLTVDDVQGPLRRTRAEAQLVREALDDLGQR